MLDSAMFPGGGAQKVWASGMPVAQWEAVISPLDGEVYRRKTATGSGATDPADDTTNYNAVSYDRILAVGQGITGSTARTGWSSTSTAAAVATVTANPTMTGGVRTRVLSISGSGTLDFFAVRSAFSTSTVTKRIEVVIDGRTVFDVTASTSALSAAGDFWPVIGNLMPTQTAGDFLPIYDPISFKRSVQVFLTVSENPGSAVQFWTKYKGVA